MKIEITIPTPNAGTAKLIIGGAIVAISIGIFAYLGLATWLLALGFLLLLLAIGLMWSSITSLEDQGEVTLEEALDLGAPARDEERKLAVLRGIKDLEYERSLGKISEQDYSELIQRYRGEAKRLLEKLDTSDASLRERAHELAQAKIAPGDTSKDISKGSEKRPAEEVIEKSPIEVANTAP